MSKELVNAPAARSWRDIPQPVRPRAMSRSGRWRLATATLRTAAGVVLVGSVAWGGWELAAVLRERPAAPPLTVRALPLKAPELLTTREGVLDSAWLARTLALPPHASLMPLDLARLRERVLADGQVLTATVTKRFPDRLIVQVSERLPVARVMAEVSGARQPLLVARDGVVYPGTNYDPSALATLPWLDGIALTRRGGNFLPVAGMAVVSELLTKAQLEAPRLYQTWEVVSLAQLASDREIEVRTRAPLAVTIVFGADAPDPFQRQQGFFRQLARLDYLWDNLAAQAAAPARVDLSLGAQVPVMVSAPRPDRAGAGAARPVAAGPAFSLQSSVQPRNPREL